MLIAGEDVSIFQTGCALVVMSQFKKERKKKNSTKWPLRSSESVISIQKPLNIEKAYITAMHKASSADLDTILRLREDG